MLYLKYIVNRVSGINANIEKLDQLAKPHINLAPRLKNLFMLLKLK